MLYNIYVDMDIQMDVVAAAVASASGAVFLYKRFIKPTTIFIKRQVDAISKIDKIYSEFHVNGGSSLKDAINRIEVKLLGVEQKQNIYLLESPQGIYETDNKGKCISVNRTYCRIVKRTEKEILGNGWLNSIAEYDRERVYEIWTNSIENQIEFICKYDMVSSEGEVIPVNGVAYPMEHPINHQIIGYLGTINVDLEENTPLDN